MSASSDDSSRSPQAAPDSGAIKHRSDAPSKRPLLVAQRLRSCSQAYSRAKYRFLCMVNGRWPSATPYAVRFLVNSVFFAIDVALRWIMELCDSILGDRGYLTAGSMLAAYLAVFGLVDAKSTEEETRASLERSSFTSLVTSGNTASFVSGLKEFGKTQTINVTEHPSLYKFWQWGRTWQPNREPLLRWATWRLQFCQEGTTRDCSEDKPSDPDNVGMSATWDVGASEARRIDFSDTDLRGADLSGVDLRAANFEGANLEGADFSFANLQSAYFSQHTLSKVNFTCARLRHARVNNADFSGSVLDGADMVDVDLFNDKFVGTRAEGTMFNSADLQGADFTGADLSYADFSTYRSSVFAARPTKLTGVIFRRANLSGTNLEDADLSRATADGAIYNANTKLPASFDIAKKGLVFTTTTTGDVVNNTLCRK